MLKQDSPPAAEAAYRPWRLAWTQEHIRRFWNWRGTHETQDSASFSKQVGDVVLDHVQRHISLGGRCLDYGAGRGDLVEKLLARKVRVVACDASDDSVDILRKRFAGNPDFEKAVVVSDAGSPFEAGSIDCAFLIESIEHFLDEYLGGTLANLNRMIRPGGHIVVTTPNEENLSKREACCPNCGCTFHTVQHVRSFSATTLSALMAEHGFEKISCEATLFHRSPRPVRRALGVGLRLSGRQLPHLVYVGAKIR